MLEVRKLCGGYRPRAEVFSDISFDLASGAIGVIGRNGAGKSCLAKTLSGALVAFDGSIRVDGNDLNGLDSRARVRLGISLVPEGPHSAS